MLTNTKARHTFFEICRASEGTALSSAVRSRCFLGFTLPEGFGEGVREGRELCDVQALAADRGLVSAGGKDLIDLLLAYFFKLF